MNSIHYAAASAVCLSVLTGAGCHKLGEADHTAGNSLNPSAAFGQNRLPSFPLGCLRRAGCDVRKDINALEIGNEPMEDWNFDAQGNLVAFDAEAARYRRKLLSEAEPIRRQINERAVARAKDQQDPKGEWEAKANVRMRTEKKELPPLPDSWIRMSNAYVVSAAFSQCATGYETLALAQTYKMPDGDKRDAILAVAYAGYVYGCFRPAPGWLKSRIAIFWTPWPALPPGPKGAFCLGYSLDDRHVITAKHCVVDPNAMRLWVDAKSKEPIPLSMVPRSRIVFADALGRDYEYKISPLHSALGDNTYDPVAFGEDVAIVTLSTPHTVPEADVEAPSPWRLIMTVTSFVSLGLIQACLRGERGVECDGSTLVRFDNTPNCVAPTEKSGCLLHACQTRPGASGGPILAQDDVGRTLIGVHTGSIDLEHPQCALPKGNLFPNFGASVFRSKVLSAWKQARRG